MPAAGTAHILGHKFGIADRTKPDPDRSAREEDRLSDRKQPERRKSLPQVADRPCGRAAAHAGQPASTAAAGSSAPPQAAFLVDRHLHPAGLRRRHSRLPRPVATRGLGLLEGPVRLAEPDISGDRHAPSRWRRARAGARCSSAGRSAPPPRTGFASRLDQANLAPGDIVLLASPGGDLNQATIMGEIIRAARARDRGRQRRRLGPRQAGLLRQRLRARLCRGQDPLRRPGLGAWAFIGLSQPGP